jgi:orotidine-5'-phosphate decarboxylase
MLKQEESLIVALDYPTASEALALVDALGDAVVFYKVGMQLYYAAGNAIITELKKRNKKIFLDLKINDIPETVSKVVATVIELGVEYLTLFTNEAQIRAAANVVGKSNSSLKLLNVTVLTSEQSTFAEVNARATMSLKAGADGLICSGLEVAELRQIHGVSPILVTPGIRLAEAKADDQGTRSSGSAARTDTPRADDQQRIVTPRDAIRAGATNLVVGRPITQAKDPRAAALKILEEISSTAKA